MAQVENRPRGSGGTPPFADVLSDKEIDAVVRHVVEQIAAKE